MTKREHIFSFWLNDEELHKIQEKMSLSGITNQSAYFRKMAIDGKIIKLNMSEITELNSLLRRYNNNINQIAKKVNSTGSIYQNEINDIKNEQNTIYQYLNEVLKKLSKLG